MRTGQYQVQVEEEGKGEGDLIKIGEISEREPEKLPDEMNFQFALEDWR